MDDDTPTTKALAASALRAHQRSNGPESIRLLAVLGERPPEDVSKAWLLVAKRAYDALPADMADELLRDADELSGVADAPDLIAQAWDQATTFLSQAAAGFVDSESLRMIQQRNPYLPAQLLRAVMIFAAELPAEVASTALDAVIEKHGST